MYTNSNNSSKAGKFFGHHIGCITFLTGKLSKLFAVPAILEIHEGLKQLRQLREGDNHPVENPTVITNMISLSHIVAVKANKPIYAVLDALYSAGRVFHMSASWLMKDGKPWVHLIVKGKKNYTAYSNASKKKNDKIKLWELFDQPRLFIDSTHPITSKPISYYHANLFWPPAGSLIRFVLVRQGGKRFLLMSSDLELDPITAIHIYSLRSKIEVTFGVLKNAIGGFCYRFWSFTSPKLRKKKIKKKDRGKEVDVALKKPALYKLTHKVEVMERFMNLAAIVVGLLQYMAITYTAEIWKSCYKNSWLRTYSSEIPSEETVKRVIQSSWFIASKKRRFFWAKELIASFNDRVLKRSKVKRHQTLESVTNQLIADRGGSLRGKPSPTA